MYRIHVSSVLLSFAYTGCFFVKLLSFKELGNVETYFLIFTQTLSITMSIVVALLFGFHVKYVI